MNFKTNFNKNVLMGNEVIKIYFENKTVEFVPPNLRLYLMDLDFLEILYVLKQDPETFNKNINQTNMKIESRYGILRFFLFTKYKFEIFTKFINTLFPNIKILENSLSCDGSDITNEEYELLLDFIAVSCGEVNYQDFIKKIEGVTLSKDEDKLSPAEKRMKEVKEKLEAVKAKGKKKNQKESKGNAITIDQIVIAVLYEFTSLSFDDIYNMNMFTLMELYSYVGKIVDSKIQIVAAGNGLLKEFTYFIN